MIAYQKILDNVARKKGYGRLTLEGYVNEFLMEAANCLREDESVDLGPFGRFKPSKVKEHVLSFNTDKKVPAHTKVTFQNGDELKDYINGETDSFVLKTKKPTQ